MELKIGKLNNFCAHSYEFYFLLLFLLPEVPVALVLWPLISSFALDFQERQSREPDPLLGLLVFELLSDVDLCDVIAIRQLYVCHTSWRYLTPWSRA